MLRVTTLVENGKEVGICVHDNVTVTMLSISLLGSIATIVFMLLW